MRRIAVALCGICTAGCIVIPFGAAGRGSGEDDRNQNDDRTEIRQTSTLVSSSSSLSGIRYGVQVSLDGAVAQGSPRFEYVYYLENSGSERVRVEWDETSPLPADESGLVLDPGERREFQMTQDGQPGVASNMRITVLDD